MKIEDPIKFAQHGGYQVQIHGADYQLDEAARFVSLGVRRMSFFSGGTFIGEASRDDSVWEFTKMSSEDNPWAVRLGRFDESKHPRGGNPKNRGQFSEKRGSGPAMVSGTKPSRERRPRRIKEKEQAREKARERKKPKLYGRRDAKIHTVDVTSSTRKSGVTDAARVGVPGDQIPKSVPRVPNLKPDERRAETSFIKYWERNPKMSVARYTAIVKRTAKEKEAEYFRETGMKRRFPPTYETDQAKLLSGDWVDDDPKIERKKRAAYNTALHGTANAIAKAAFLKHLDTLSKGDTVLVTCGGCGAGKGYCLSEGSKLYPDTVGKITDGAAVVWDSAGDQNGTESPWVLQEALKRGLKVHFMYVHADPANSWAGKFGVVTRARGNGRMVDARVFADSYAIGAKNHHALYETHRDNPQISWTFMANTGKEPQMLDGVPPKSLEWDNNQIAEFAVKQIDQRYYSGELNAAHIYRAARAGFDRLWKAMHNG